MTKADMIDKIMQKTGLEKPIVTVVVEAFMQTMRASLLSGHSIFLRGLATFTLKKRAEKKARNISKGTMIIVPAHYDVEMIPSKQFANRVKETVTDDTIKMAAVAEASGKY